MRKIKFRGMLKEDNHQWVYGHYYEEAAPLQPVGKQEPGTPYIVFPAFADWNMPRQMLRAEVSPDTVGQFTGLKDKNDKEIYEGDITELVLPNGEARRFVVAIETVVREVVSHPDFDEPTATVAITGVVFRWRGFELFPYIDENGRHDNENMQIIGNIYENPELLEE
jgi:uncharacterized phage protein (TIGR01671 family)